MESDFIIDIDARLSKPIKTKYKGQLLAAFIGASLMVPTVQVIAQDSRVLEEILVTSRRYEESINDAPLAVNVMDADYLRDQGVTSIQDVLELTPGATWGMFTAAQPGLTVRGVNAGTLGNASLEGGVQVVVDGIARTKSFMISIPAYDLSRVEVMRGPQGTTFGRNATLGLMHFVTAKPSQEYEAGINATAGSLGLAGVDGFVSGAVSDNLSARFAFLKKQEDGAIEDETTGDALEGYDITALRGSLLYEPSADFTALVTAEYVNNDDLPPVRKGDSSCTVPWLASGPYINEYVSPCDPWKATQSPPPPGGFFTKREMYFLSAEFAWNLQNDLTVTSLSGYQTGTHHNLQDAFGTPEVLQDQEVRNDGTVYSTELRIDNSASGDALGWLGGVYLSADTEDRLEMNTAFPARGIGGGRIGPQPEAVNTTTSTSDNTSFGLFGSVNFDISDDLAVAIGGRYSSDSRDYLFANECYGRAGNCGSFGAVSAEYGGNVAQECSSNIVAGLCGDVNNPMGIVTPESLSDTWTNFSTSISLTYAVTENSNIYALYSEGFKAGGFQHDARNLEALLSRIVDSEEVTNIEFGWKGSYDTFRFALTGFIMELKNAQASGLVPVGASNTSSVLNFGGKDQNGVEFEGAWLVTDALQIGGNFGIYDGTNGDGSFVGARVDDVTGQVIGTDVSGNATGMENSYVAYGEYDFNLGGGSTVRLRADIHHRGFIPGGSRAATLTLDGARSSYDEQPIDYVGARATWTSSDENLRVSLWGKNLKDDWEWTNIGPGIGFHFNQGSPPHGYTGRRQLGADISYSF